MKTKELIFTLLIVSLGISCAFNLKRREEPSIVRAFGPIASSTRYLERSFDLAKVDSDFTYLTAFNPDSGKNLNLEVHHCYPAADTIANGDTVSAWVILFQHGGGWKSGVPSWYTDLCLRSAQYGYHFLSFDYRLTGQDDGWIYGTGDYLSAISWTKAHAGSLHVDTTRMILSGESAGAYNSLSAIFDSSAVDSQATILAGTTASADFAIPISGAMILDLNATSTEYWNHTSAFDQYDEGKSYLLNSELDAIVEKTWVDSTSDSSRVRDTTGRFILWGDNSHAIGEYPPGSGLDGTNYVLTILGNVAYKHFNNAEGLRLRFPSRTDVLDDFNRSNEGPPPSASWTKVGGAGTKVVANEIAGGGTGYGYGHWNTTYSPTGDGMELWVTVSAKGVTDNIYGLWPWSNGGLTVGALDGYEIEFKPKTATNTDIVEFYRWDNGVRTKLGNSVFFEWKNGDQIGARYDGNSNILTAYWRPSQNQDSFVLATRTDGTYGNGNGKLAIAIQGTAPRLDDFGGGEVRLKRGL